MMKKLTIKDCPLCGKIIWNRKMLPLIQFQKGTILFNFLKIVSISINEYGDHIWFLLSDGSRMRVAVCKDCIEKMTDEKAREIFSYITYTKLEIAKKSKWQSYDYLRTLEMFKWFKTENEAKEYLEKYKNAKKCSD